ncbi:MAG: acyltransferase [Prosthecobacter sp.]|uniref:acyltransferase family protein n=1 Tax=Prosthecobacter sp. TaxID=1965333 RepID=UPI0025EE1C13|nr:acyltransferase [Prosthecobacter sp.]MCF7787331.1 acyltransferase [Prosthecobacter sp.]
MHPPATTPSKAGHQWPLDGLRGVASLAVVMAHFGGIFYPAAVFGGSFAAHSSLESTFWQSPLVLLSHGELAVCIFFVLSGYVLTFRDVADTRSARAHALLNMLKRPVRLGGMVLCMMFLSYGLKLLGGYKIEEAGLLSGSEKYVAGSLDFGTWLRGFLQEALFSPFSTGYKYDPPLWTIRDELWGSWVVFGVLLLAPRPSWRMWLCLILLPICHGSHIQGMVLGMMLARASQLPWFGKVLGRAGVSLALLAVAFPLCCYPYYVRQFSPADFAVSWYGSWPALEWQAGSWCMVGAFILVAVLVRWGGSLPTGAKGFFTWLGKLSFALYAVHFIVLGSCTAQVYLALRQHAFGHHAAAGMALAFTLPVLTAVSWILWRCVDVPSIQISRNLSDWVARRFKIGPRRTATGA